VEVYQAPSERALARLYAGSNVYVAEYKNGWAKIVTVVSTATQNFDEYTLELNPRTRLYSTGKVHEVGRIYGKLKLQGLYNYTDKTVTFELIGYIRASQIDTNWIPEKRLVQLIDSTQSKISYTNVLPDITKYNFFVSTEDSGFIAFQLNDIKGLDFKNPIERLKLIFYEQRLVAIFHKNPFPLHAKEVIQIDGRENLIYLRDLSAAEKKIFGELFLSL